MPGDFAAGRQKLQLTYSCTCLVVGTRLQHGIVIAIYRYKNKFYEPGLLNARGLACCQAHIQRFATIRGVQ